MMRRTFEHRGVTVLELMVTIAVLSILLVVGVPSMLDAAERRRTIAAAEQIYSQLQLARAQSVARSGEVYANFVNGASWAIGVSDNAACDPSDNMPACTLPDVDGANAITQIVSAADYDSVAVSSTAAQITFSPQRATATAATIVITSNGNVGYTISIEVGVLGQIGMCSSDADPAKFVPGYRTC